MDKPNVADHYNAEAANYFQQYQRNNLRPDAEYPANYFRLQILVQRMAMLGVKSVYEVGVGEGTPLATMAGMGFRVAGCDIADEMVKATQETFKARSLSHFDISWGDVEDSNTLARQRAGGSFDAVMALGVLPHVKKDRMAIMNMSMMLRDGGHLFVEFRNKLFSLFTMNRYTKEFVLDDLLRDVDPAVKISVSAELDRRLATDLPPLRLQTGNGAAPGYDAILSKFHNPFELSELVESCGFKDIKIHWYHYHPAPPMLERDLGLAFRKAAMALEHEQSWRGYFLCSAGVLEATRK
ncbi:MAG TPA: methyltransferase domain-containing protein [Xanthobacteraceae bacterium]|jgi:2-polyprenyl-3-methyl-5-hydroxy-6-metoxy-1,4-benzoquinol methylase|nr:methyltransferase domain-containing protein [Xanthobacteraceae bacterium]